MSAGAGNPRLIFNIGSTDWDGAPAREFPLVDEVTEIGSAASATLRLDDVAPTEARIVHEDDDEYVLYILGVAGHGLDGDPHDPAPFREILRTGATVQIGEWSMFFQRDESAEPVIAAP